MTGYEILDAEKIGEKPSYWFIGGLRYSTGDFSPEPQADIEYPYTTYFTSKIHNFKDDGITYVPLSEINLPLIVLQYEDSCLAARIEPVLENSEGEKIHHFIGFDREEREVKIVNPENFRKSSKKAEWLGKADSETIKNPDYEKNYSLKFEEYENWREAVREIIGEETPELEEKRDLQEIFRDAKEWLYRSWDAENGTFLQLPWREKPGFALDEYSYSLMANEAVRVNYFDQLGDENFPEFSGWSERLVDLFKDEKLQKKDLKKGKGLTWYNTASFNGESLEGEFYLGTGYFGYPGGQSTISLNLLEYLDQQEDPELEKNIQENLEYILSTQKDSGHWPAALKQELEIPFKKDEYYGLRSEGATGESVRALLKAYQRFGDEKYQDAAVRGLEALTTDTPICRNGLRDIGTQEVEAFSAFSVINAFLDAYELLGDEKYLEQAENYSYYLTTWLCWFKVGSRDLRGVCHPISETITMRISPFETVKAAKTFLRVSQNSEDELWRRTADLCFRRALESINDTGGMSEGIFYDFEDGLENLETEQTFATSELLHTIKEFMDESGEKVEEEKDKELEELDVEVLDGSRIGVEDKAVFDLEKMGFSSINGSNENHELVFEGPYSRKSTWRSKIFSKMRYSKFLLAPKDLKYLWSGIRPQERDRRGEKFSDVEKNIETEQRNGRVLFEVDTEIYSFEGEVSRFQDGQEELFSVDLSVTSSKHDLLCDSVILKTDIFPENGVLEEQGYSLSLERSEDSEKGFDLSRQANWTHAGIYMGELELRLKD